MKSVHSDTAATVVSKSLKLVGSVVFHAELSNLTQLINNKCEIRMTDGFHRDRVYFRNLTFQLQTRYRSLVDSLSVSLSLSLTHTHHAFNLL